MKSALHVPGEGENPSFQTLPSLPLPSSSDSILAMENVQYHLLMI